MVGAAKARANKERQSRRSDKASSSGGTSSSGKPSGSAVSSRQSSGNHSSHGRFDGNRDPGSPKDPGSAKAPDSPRERNPPRSAPIQVPKNLDIGVSAWGSALSLEGLSGLPSRPAPSKLGQPLKMTLNTFHVETLPTKPVYQFDVMVGNGGEKRGLIKKVWSSKTLRKEIGHAWIFDGNKIAWAMKPIDRDIKITVDLDAEQGRKPGKKPNVHRVLIRQTVRVSLDVLQVYMNGKCSFDKSCLEALNFMDHLLREWPSSQYSQIKRSFFARGQTRFDLGGAIEAFKGVYQSMRIVHGGLGGGARLSINVDVANGTFWTASQLPLAVGALLGRRDVSDLVNTLSDEKSQYAREQLRKKMKKLRVVMKHRGGEEDEYVISRFIYKSAREHTFEKDGKSISIYDYFAKQYQIRLQYPNLPLIETTKKAVLPMELCVVKENQRYPFKLDERQTTGMLKVAAVPPPERWTNVQHGLSMLKWNSDPVLKEFGVRINTTAALVDARLLPAPKVQFGQGDARPGTSGRWDLKGKQFLSTNLAPLKSWSVTVISGRGRGGKPDKAVVEHFIKEFIKIYQSHGGRVENKQPPMIPAPGDDVGGWVTAGWNAAGNQAQARPQMLVFILPDKNAETYGRIKRSADCRYGVVSQCMQYSHVQKAQPQYISNVLMKFNAKLGGQTARAIGGPKSSGPTGLFTAPTMIIGADVSHAAPGAQTPSMAALTVSMDKLGIRYAADCQTNGFRVEMITTDNINSMLKPMIQHWVQNVGGGQFPARIMYFRDGVSEGQYQHVLQQEVHDMKALLRTANPNLNVKFIVAVGGKRHHVRFFPEKGKGDRNGNPHPGTLVETGATHPFENDFYLCSHSAIKGTARPMHYHVLLNEVGMSNEELQTLIYEHSYQYIRSTTPVSQHPAIYYAHLASNRAIPHDKKWNNSTDDTISAPGGRERSGSRSGSQDARSGGKSGDKPGGSSSGAPTEFEKLMPMPNQGGIMTSMWYI